MSTSQRQRLQLFARIWCVPAVLIVVACIHMNQWHTIKRSSWGTGVGFGMFATVDYHGSRFLYCTAETDQGLIELEAPQAIRDQAGLAARTIPSERNLLRLAEAMYQQAWYLDVDQNDLTFGNTMPKERNESKRLAIHSLEIKIGGMQIHSRDKKLVTHLINSVTFPSQPIPANAECAESQNLSCSNSKAGTTDDARP